MANNNYNGNIELIAGLTQANKQNFPLVDSSAVNVAVDGLQAERLDLALEELLNKGVKVEDIQKLIEDMGIENNINILLENVETINNIIDTIVNDDSRYIIQYDLETQTLDLNVVKPVADKNAENVNSYWFYNTLTGKYEKETTFDEEKDYYTLDILSSTIIPYDSSKNIYSISAAINGSANFTTLLGKKAEISYSFGVKDSDDEQLPVARGTAEYYVNGKLIFKETVNKGTIKKEISEYLSSGSNIVSVVLSWERATGDLVETAKSRTLSWNIRQTEMKILSTFNPSEIQTGAFQLYYTPIGNGLDKVVTVLLDGEVYWTDNVGKLSNISRSVEIAAQSHGSHNIEIYCSTVINGEDIKSDSLFYDIICVEVGDKTPIIRTTFDYQSVVQYNTKKIGYSVYVPSKGITGESNVKLKVDGAVVSEISAVNAQTYEWEYRPGSEIKYAQEAGVYIEDEKIIILSIECEGAEKELELTVERFPYDINQVEAGLMLDFNPIGKTNSDADAKDFNYNGIDWSVSDNFDWINGGYQTINGEKCFIVKTGTSVTFNYGLFDNDPIKTGREFKVIYKVSNVKKTDSSWLTCLSDDGTLGLNMRPHETYVSHDGATLYHPLSEEDIIEFDMNLSKAGSEIEMILTYEDGCPAYPLIYKSGEGGNKINHSNYITVGSDECDVILYRLKAYSTDLSDSDVLMNFEADARDAETMISRFTRNQIFDYEAGDEYADNLTPQKLSEICPDLRIITIEAPYFTKGKKEFLGNTHVKCYYQNGTRFDDNWEAWNCVHAGQGTSSDSYGPSGRNIDIYMCIDGDKNGGVKSNDGLKLEGQAGIDLAGGKTILKYGKENYFEVKNPTLEKISDYYELKDGEYKKTEDEEIQDKKYFILTDTIDDGTGKVSLTDSSIPNNIWNIKVNIASSENANNALLQKRFDRYVVNAYTPYAKQKDSRVKGGMEFFNCVVFIRETDESTSGEGDNLKYTNHREFNDTKWHFYAIGNLGDSKKTDATRASDSKDADEFTIEITDWNHPLSNFPMGDKWFAINDSNSENDDGTYSLRYLTNKNRDKGYVYRRLGAEGNYTYQQMTADDIDLDVGQGIVSIDEKGNTVTTETFYTQAKNIPSMEDYDDEWNYDARYKGKNKSYKVVWPVFYDFVTREVKTEAERLAWVSELKEWFCGDGAAVFFWYLFTLRYTMVDNRGKNTFWHWGKTGVYHKVSKPNAKMLKAGLYAIKDEDIYSIVAKSDDNVLDENTEYYCQYAFDFWDYDNDTALGIDNIGVLSMDYGVEDGVNEEDDFHDGIAHFRCHDSTLFTRVRDWCTKDLEKLYQQIGRECWSAEHLISEFDKWQNQFPEALWHLDYLRKYRRPYLGSYFYTADDAYLTGKMNGRKKYQRRQFERNQDFYFQSKFDFWYYEPLYMRGSGVKKDAKPDVSNQITLTAYSKMYVKITRNQRDGAEPTYSKRRLGAGESMTATFAEYENGGIEILNIFGADHLSSLGDLSKLYLQEIHLGGATKLQELILGNAEPGYSNNALPSDKIAFSGNPLLETIDIQNISSLNGTLVLSELTSLKTLKADGTNISKVVFAQGGMLKEAYLPGTITSISLKNLSYLDNLNIKDITLIKEVNIQNCSKLNSYNLVKSLPNLERLTLTNIDWNKDYNISNAELFNKFIQLKGFDELNNEIDQSLLTGNVYIDKVVRSELESFNLAWPKLNITYNPSSFIEQYPVYFYNYDGTLLLTQWVSGGSAITDPKIKPTKPSDDMNHYEFKFWIQEGEDDRFIFSTSSVLGPMSLYASFDSTPRTYNVNWYGYNNELLLTEEDIQYGSSVSYTKDIPTRATENGTTFFMFKGWSEKTNKVVKDMNIYAEWYETSITNELLNKTLQELKPHEMLAIAEYTRNRESLTFISDKTWKPQSTIEVQLGHLLDTNEEDSFNIIDEVHEFQPRNGDGLIVTPYRLFNTSKDWVLAIDYEFNFTDKDKSILIGCGDGNSGVSLYTQNGEVFVQYGSQSVKLPTPKLLNQYVLTQRDMVVIKHIKGESKIKVFMNDRYALTDIYSTELVLTNEVPISNALTLGGLGAAIDISGNGKLYNVRYYEKEIDDLTCKKMVSWIYEKKSFNLYNSTNQISGQIKYDLIDVNYRSPKTRASFIMTDLLDRLYTLKSDMGFGDSNLCQWLNTKFIKAFPDDFLAMFRKINYQSNTGTEFESDDYYTKNLSLGKTTTVHKSSVKGTPCYLTAPSLIEVSTMTQTEDYYRLEGSQSPIDALLLNSVAIKNLNGQAQTYFTSSAYPYGWVKRETNGLITKNNYYQWNKINENGNLNNDNNLTAGVTVCFHI